MAYTNTPLLQYFGYEPTSTWTDNAAQLDNALLATQSSVLFNKNFSCELIIGIMVYYEMHSEEAPDCHL